MQAASTSATALHATTKTTASAAKINVVNANANTTHTANTSAIKVKTPTRNTSNTATGTATLASANTSNEIEEISKQISEHADAIYRTWKCRGLAPTELLEFYTNAATTAATDSTTASDFLAATTKVVAGADDTAEGLQKLVSTFVIKDKEQRGVKVAKGKSAIIKSQEVADAVGNNMATKVTVKPKVITQKSAILMKPNEPASDGVDAVGGGGLKKKVVKTTTSSATSANAGLLSAGGVVGGSVGASKSKMIGNTLQQQQHHKSNDHQTTLGVKKVQQKVIRSKSPTQGIVGGGPSPVAKTATTTTKTTTPSTTKLSGPSVDINLNLDLNLDLNLSDLSELQSQHLLKIKELLQQESGTAESSKVKAKKSPTTSTKTEEAKTIAVTTKTPISITSNQRQLLSGAGNSGSGGKETTVAAAKSNKHIANAATPTTPTSTLAPVTVNGRDGSEVTASMVDGGGGGGGGGGGSTIGANLADKNSSRNSSISGNGNKRTTTTTTPKVSAKSLNDNQQQQQQQPPQTTQQSAPLVGQHGKVKENDKAPTTKISNKIVKGVIKESSNGTGNTNSNSNDINNGHSSHSHSSKIFKEKPDKTEKKESAKITTHTSSTTTTTTAAPAPPSAVASPATAALVVGVENGMEVARNGMPAKLTKSGRPLVNGPDKNLGRPILTRGSVAERVMMFEKCPDVRNSFLNIKRPDPADAPPKSLLKAKLHSTPPPPPDHNSLQREIRSTKSVYIPRFYFPHGKPQPTIALERTLRGILSAFDSFPNNQVTKDELPRILKLCGLPFYWRMPVMIFCQQGNSGLVERQRFVEFWKQMNVYCHDNASRFVYILSRGQRFRSHILPEDLAPLVQDVVDTHPGLAFLKEATEFHSRYVHTVIARIFYSVNRCWSGRITISELKKSDLLEIISLLEEEDDINQIMAFFSYEHFYVIYCKFWELDKDHDLLINQDDLARHSDHALSTRIVERIFSGCVTRGDNKKNPEDEPKMSYTDFVWFLLSEEDKRTPTAIEYWFRCMDVDGDGMLSMYELEYFYEEQQQRMESIGIETLPFEDCLCQMLDMIKPQQRDCITLGDLKRCKMTHVFFDTFFNLEKYLDHEQRDPFASQRDEYASDWDRFAAQEYELLISEENE